MADLDMEIIQNNKGGVKLSLAGYLYTKEHTTKYGIQWELLSVVVSTVKAKHLLIYWYSVNPLLLQ